MAAALVDSPAASDHSMLTGRTLQMANPKRSMERGRAFVRTRGGAAWAWQSRWSFYDQPREVFSVAFAAALINADGSALLVFSRNAFLFISRTPSSACVRNCRIPSVVPPTAVVGTKAGQFGGEPWPNVVRMDDHEPVAAARATQWRKPTSVWHGYRPMALGCFSWTLRLLDRWCRNGATAVAGDGDAFPVDRAAAAALSARVGKTDPWGPLPDDLFLAVLLQQRFA